MSDKDLIVVAFKTVTRQNKAKSKEAGRAIYDEREVCEIRFSGDRNRVGVFPAHDVCAWVDGDPVTYAMRYSDQYRRFKAGTTQVKEGTPLEELPFLTQAKRMELKALSIYTAEALASIDGQPLKSLGIGGRELKNQAQAFIDKARGSADVTAMASEIAMLKQQIAEMSAAPREPVSEPAATPTAPSSEFADWSDEDLKSWIAEHTGTRPRGNPSRETLERMVSDLQQQAA